MSARSAERRLQLAAHPVAYPLIRGLARLGPVVRVPRVGVVVSDAGIARAVLTDTEHFSKTGPGSPAELWTPVVGPSVLLNMEGAAHAALRRRLAELFTPAAVGSLCARVAREPLDAVRSTLAAGRPLDLVPVVRGLAGAVIAELVGLAAPGPAFDAATALTGMVRLARPRLTPRQVSRGRRTMAVLTAPAAAAYREGDPATVPGRMRALGLTEAEALGAVAAFALTGTETVVSFVPRLVAILADAGRLDELAADRSTVDDVVAEALRVTAPSPVMLRSVAAPARVGPVAVHPGDRVVISTISAARVLGGFDPDRPHPPELRKLWFGAGPHFCLGMPLALAEIRAVLDVVLDAHAERPLHVARRRAARRVLVPAYRELVLGSG